MVSNLIKRWDTKRSIVELIASTNWKSGIPKDPTIPKYLVQVFDKAVDAEPYVPTDPQLRLLSFQWRGQDLKNLVEALQLKETHNLPNLKNPEPRKIERLLAEALRVLEVRAEARGNIQKRTVFNEELAILRKSLEELKNEDFTVRGA